MIDLQSSSTIYNPQAFAEFLKLQGTYYINGLASCQIGPRLVHPFEAHGYVKSLSFDGEGRLVLQKSIINTPLTKMERERNAPIARGVMSSLDDVTSLTGWWRNVFAPTERDTANLVANLWPRPSSEVVKQGILEPLLIVATDNGTPYVLDPATLEMRGTLAQILTDMAARDPNLSYLKESARVVGTTKMLAHTRYDEKRQRFILCSTEMVLPGDQFKGNVILTFYEFNTAFRLVARKKYKTRFMVMHDWMITDDYYVVPKNPARLRWGNIFKFLAGLVLGVQVFAMEVDCVGELVLIPRHDKDAPVIEAKADRFFNIFHFGPCYQQDEDKGKVVVYAGVFDSYDFGGEMGFDCTMQEFDPIAWGSCGRAPAPRVDKFVVCTKDGKVMERERMKIVKLEDQEDVPLDMLRFASDGAQCRYFYGLGASRKEGWFPFRSVVKVDTLRNITYNWDAGDTRVVSEPMFIPKQMRAGTNDAIKEDDGFLVSVVHDAPDQTCHLAVWDAVNFDQGPIGIIGLGDLVPWCVHGSWVPYYINSKLSK